MELRQLHLFITLAEELHFGRAAEREHLTQPAFGRRIRSLEHELGVALFTRTSRRVELTEAGNELLPLARRLLVDAQEAEAAIRRLAEKPAASLRIGYTVLPPRELLTAFLSAVDEVAPDVRPHIATLWWSEQLEAVLAGALDIGFVGAPVDDARLDCHVLLEETLVAVAPRGAAPPGPVSLAQLSGLPAVTLPRWIAPAAYDAIHGLLRAAGSRDVLAETTEHSVTRELVSGGRAITVVPASLARDWDDVTVHPITPRPPTITYLAVWRRDRRLPMIEAALSHMARRQPATTAREGLSDSVTLSATLERAELQVDESTT